MNWALRHIAVWIFFGLLCAVPAAFGDESPFEWRGTVDYRIDNENYWKSYVADGANFATAPARWEKEDWLTVGSVAGGTAALFLLDDDIMKTVQRNRSGITDGLGDVGEIFGNELFVFPGLAALYLYGHGNEDKTSRKAALRSLESWFYSSAVTVALKRSFHRHRPHSGNGSGQWDGPGIGGENLSFPSGHASTAWSVATVIATEYGDVPYVPHVAYAAASLASWSRVNAGEHWASDVFFSSFTGYFIGKAVTQWHKDDSFGRLTLLPVADSQSFWLVADYRF